MRTQSKPNSASAAASRWRRRQRTPRPPLHQLPSQSLLRMPRCRISPPLPKAPMRIGTDSKTSRNRRGCRSFCGFSSALVLFFWPHCSKNCFGTAFFKIQRLPQFGAHSCKKAHGKCRVLFYFLSLFPYWPSSRFSFSMLASMRESVSCLPRISASSVAPPGVTAVPEMATRTGQSTLPFFTSSFSASAQSAA